MLAHLKVILLVLYFAAPFAVLLTPSLRSRRTIRALLLMVVADFLIFGIIEGTKQGFYLVHVLPLLEGLLALWIVETWNARPDPDAGRTFLNPLDGRRWH